MLYPSEEQSEAMRRCALFLERHDYDDVRLFLKSLSKKDFTFFWQFLLEEDLLSEIAKDKNRLASFVAKNCSVSALPEDRKRIVFTIARPGNVGFSGINDALKKEFGSYFKLLDKYNLDKRVVSWQNIVQKAKEIRNGYVNLANLAIESQILTMMNHYKMSTTTDIKKIDYLDKLAKKILDKSANKFELPPSSPSLAEVMPLIVEFYKATDRLQLDIDHLWEAPNIEDALMYITVLNTVFETKLKLAKEQIPITDLKVAEEEMRKEMREIYFNSTLISLDEMIREHIPLELVKPTKSV